MPRAFIYAVWIVVALAMVPPVMIGLARAKVSSKPRIHLIPDMDSQEKFRAQAVNPIFADGRAMRPPVAGAVARGMLHEDDFLHRGQKDGAWAKGFPIPVNEALMQRGRERFDIFCAPCHGLAGYGDGPVHVRAEALEEGTWVQPTSYHDGLVADRAEGHIFNTITHGSGNMPPLGDQITAEDRWGIILYLRALQRSQHATLEDVPPEIRASLK